MEAFDRVGPESRKFIDTWGCFLVLVLMFRPLIP
jgi:hypothetical protein